MENLADAFCGSEDVLVGVRSFHAAHAPARDSRGQNGGGDGIRRSPRSALEASRSPDVGRCDFTLVPPTLTALGATWCDRGPRADACSDDRPTARSQAC